MFNFTELEDLQLKVFTTLKYFLPIKACSITFSSFKLHRLLRLKTCLLWHNFNIFWSLMKNTEYSLYLPCRNGRKWIMDGKQLVNGRKVFGCIVLVYFPIVHWQLLTYNLWYLSCMKYEVIKFYSEIPLSCFSSFVNNEYLKIYLKFWDLHLV